MSWTAGDEWANAHYVDYSELWFCQIRKGHLPSVRSGKFIVIANGSSRWAVFSPNELSAYHASIAERFFASLNVPGRYNTVTKRFIPIGPDWRILGGGMWRCKSDTLWIWDRSLAYGGVDLDALAECLQALTGWAKVLAE